MKTILTTIIFTFLTLTSCKTVNDSAVSDLAGSTKSKINATTYCGSRGLPQCPVDQECIGATADDRPGTCQPKPGTLGAYCGSRGLKPCNNRLRCEGATADDRPGTCQKILCGSRGLAPCGKDLICQGASADDRPGTCEPRPGSLGASCGSRGQTPCDSGLKCTGPAANDAPGVCIQTQNPPVPAPRTEPDSRICTQAIVPLFHPPTGKCHRALNGCQAADYMELGWRKLNSDDVCK